MRGGRWVRSAPLRSFAAVAVAGVVAACSSLSLPDLGGLYGRAAAQSDAIRNPIIVIPGVLGSKLVDRDGGSTVWGAFAGDYANPRRGEGARLVALPMQEGKALSELRDHVEPNGVLDRLRLSLFGLPLELRAYVNILRTLGAGGYRDQELGEAGAIDYGDDHFTCFQFAYDWRRDNAENAARLHDYIVEKRAYVRDELERRYGIEDAEVKFDIVAHSMGGLLTRYFLRYGDQRLPEDGSLPEVSWRGAELVDRVILIGTPNAGAIESLETLVHGVDFAFFLPKYSAPILGTMPGLYQLMPRSRHRWVVDAAAPTEPIGDLYDAALWEELGWGLVAADADAELAKLLPDAVDAAERRRIARDHLAKALARARQFHESLDRIAVPPDDLLLYLYAGDAEPTPALVGVDRANGKTKVIAHGPGDGRVLRASAVMDERMGRAWTPGLLTPIRWTNVTFLFSDHLAMTNDAVFVDNVLFTLLERPSAGHGRALTGVSFDPS